MSNEELATALFAAVQAASWVMFAAGCVFVLSGDMYRAYRFLIPGVAGFGLLALGGLVWGSP